MGRHSTLRAARPLRNEAKVSHARNTFRGLAFETSRYHAV